MLLHLPATLFLSCLLIACASQLPREPVAEMPAPVPAAPAARRTLAAQEVVQPPRVTVRKFPTDDFEAELHGELTAAFATLARPAIEILDTLDEPDEQLSPVHAIARDDRRLYFEYEDKQAHLFLWVPVGNLVSVVSREARLRAEPNQPMPEEVGVWLAPGEKLDEQDRREGFVRVRLRRDGTEHTGWIDSAFLGKAYSKGARKTVTEKWWSQSPSKSYYLSEQGEALVFLDRPGGLPMFQLAEVDMVQGLDVQMDHALVEYIDGGLRLVGWVPLVDLPDRPPGEGIEYGVVRGVIGCPQRWPEQVEIPKGTCLYDHADLGHVVGKTKTVRYVDPDGDKAQPLTVGLGNHSLRLYAKRTENGFDNQCSELGNAVQ